MLGMLRRMGAAAACALALLPSKGRAQAIEDRDRAVLLDNLSDRSAEAPSAGTPEEGWQALDSAWNGALRPAASTGAEGGALPRPVFAPARPSAAVSAAEPASASISERRRKLQVQKAPGKAVNAVVGGVMGFAAGVLAGWLIGGAAAAAFVLKAPNPAVHKWRWALLLPAVVLGAVAGEIAMPFVLGYVFSKAEPYPAQGIPEGQHHA